jgi:Uma2 family endonuclease
MATDATLSPIVYPESDGKPVAENTRQLLWIVVLFHDLAAMLREAADVFVASDLFWYPVEGQPEIRTAPDVLVVFGRPKGHRSSYRQWEENGVPMTVVFEILSPGNSAAEMDDKFDFYEQHGVEEYYIYDPEKNRLKAFVRRGEVLRRVRPVDGFVSPRLGIRFDLSGAEMVVFRPDGRRFLTPEESEAARLLIEQRAENAEQRIREAERRIDEAEQQLRRAEERAERAERLAVLSRKARRGEASAEELQELDRLEGKP